MKTQGYRPSGVGGVGRVSYLPPEFKVGTSHLATITSNYRPIGARQGVFVEFGSGERLFSGVICGSQAASLQIGDKANVEVIKTFFDHGQGQWKFDLKLDACDTMRFPVSRQGYILIPKDKIDSDLDGVVIEEFADHVQEAGQVLEFCDPPAIIKINGQEHELLAPEGYLAVLDEIMSNQPFERIALEVDKRDGFYIKVKLAHAKFPGIVLGWVEVRQGRSVKIEQGDRVMCVADYKVTDIADFFKTVMEGRQGYKFISSSPPPLSELAEKTGMPEALCAFVKGLQPHNVVELIIVKNHHDCYWSVAHPDFPGQPIGFAVFGDWFLLGQGDRALFTPSPVRENFLTAAADGNLLFNHKPVKLAPGVIIEGQVSPPSDNTYNSAKEAFVRIKGSQKAVLPAFMLASRKPGETIMIKVIAETGMGWHLSVPEELYEDLLNLQQMMLSGIEAEVISDYDEAGSGDKGYKIKVNFKGLLFEATLSDQPIEGLTIGQKIVVEGGPLYLQMKTLVMHLWGQIMILEFVKRI